MVELTFHFLFSRSLLEFLLLVCNWVWLLIYSELLLLKHSLWNLFELKFFLNCFWWYGSIGFSNYRWSRFHDFSLFWVGYILFCADCIYFLLLFLIFTASGTRWMNSFAVITIIFFITMHTTVSDCTATATSNGSSAWCFWVSKCWHSKQRGKFWMYGLMKHLRWPHFIDCESFGEFIVRIVCLVVILFLFLIIVILCTSVTLCSFRFFSIPDSGTYCKSVSNIIPIQLFKDLWAIIVIGIFAKNVHFLNGSLWVIM